MQQTFVAGAFFLLRAPTQPLEVFTQMNFDDGLVALAENPKVQCALFAASSSLADKLEKSCLAEAHAGRNPTRSAFRRYVTRMSTRSTPFGLFAAVSINRFSSRSTLSLGSDVILVKRFRADMAWVMKVIHIVDQTQRKGTSGRLRRNALIHRAGDRLLLSSSDVYGVNDERHVNLKAAAGALVALDAASRPMDRRALQKRIHSHFESATDDQIIDLIDVLFGANYLVSEYRPTSFEFRPDRNLATELSISGESNMAGAVSRIADQMDMLSTASDSDLLKLMRLTRNHQIEVVPEFEGQTFQVDARLTTNDGTLSREVSETVADATTTLVRLAASLQRDRSEISRYREAFINHYGVGTLVSVKTLLSAENGLDAPEGYVNPARSWPIPGPVDASNHPTRSYERGLSKLLVGALAQGERAIEITDSVLNSLAPESSFMARPYPIVDAYAEIVSSSIESIESGNYKAVFRPESLAYGARTFSRFADLYPAETQAELATLVDYLKASRPDATFAELSYLSTHGRSGNVTSRPQLFSHEVPVNVPASVSAENIIEIDDLVVGARPDRFYLWSMRLNREVVIVQNNMLSAVTAPNVCRFLIEASMDGYSQPHGFMWGIHESAPFLPRVTRGRSILRPAQWTLLPDEQEPLNEFTFAQWRKLFQVPRYVCLIEADNRLLLDLDHRESVGELVSELALKAAPIVLQEALTTPERTWLRDAQGRSFASEIVVPLHVTAAPDSVTLFGPVEHRVGAWAATPEGDWVAFQIYATDEQQDQLIASHLLSLIDELELNLSIDQWFYLRYADPRPHLRLRCHSTKGAGNLQLRVAEWARNLVKDGFASDFTIVSYRPETVRYGGPFLSEEIGTFFAANSRTSASLLNAVILASESTKLDRQSLVVFALDNLLKDWLGEAGTVVERLNHARELSNSPDSSSAFGKRRDYITQLLEPNFNHPNEVAVTDNTALSDIVDAGTQTLDTKLLVAAIRRAERDGKLLTDSEAILKSILHMQVNRLMVSGGSEEAVSYALWARTLSNLKGRPDLKAKKIIQ